MRGPILCMHFPPIVPSDELDKNEVKVEGQNVITIKLPLRHARELPRNSHMKLFATGYVRSLQR